MADTVAPISTPVLSFPAILRNPGLKDRFAHLHGESSAANSLAPSSQIRVKKVRTDQNEGKRWVRRKDNAHFVGNPHVVAATRKDYVLPTPSIKPTFPEPLPSYLPRTVKIPVATLPTRDPVSASAGRFSLSMKGIRRELRRAGGRAEALVRDIEEEMVEWLQGGVILKPDESNAAGLDNVKFKPGEGKEIGTTGSIIEVSRTPLQLVWSVADDAFARYVVHCCARYHEVISFSKGDSNERLTYLLRPNVKQPDYRATITLATPPITDIDYSSHPDTTDVDSDFVSDRDFTDSDAEEPAVGPQTSTTATDKLEVIQETSLPSSPLVKSRTIDGTAKDEDEWSVLSADAEAYGDESSSEAGQDIADSIASLDLEHRHRQVQQMHPPIEEGKEARESDDPEKTLTQETTDIVKDILSEGRLSHHHQSPHTINRRWTRSTSSPSRSPARTRRLASAKKRRRANARNGNAGKYTSFYNYLFR